MTNQPKREGELNPDGTLPIKERCINVSFTSSSNTEPEDEQEYRKAIEKQVKEYYNEKLALWLMGGLIFGFAGGLLCDKIVSNLIIFILVIIAYFIIKNLKRIL